MSFIELFLTAIALSMDAFAVSVTTGITLRKPTPWQAIKPGLFFGGFQALMPLIGYIAGRSVAVYIEAFDHWIAFGLLALLGGKMLWDAWHGEEDGEPADPTRTGTLFLMAIATSIDALAVGISFALLSVNIVPAITLIGCTTCIISIAGVWLGNRLGELFKRRATIVGGVVLIVIGVNILIEHLFG